MAIRLLLTSKDPLILLIRHEPPPHGLKVRTQIVMFHFLDSVNNVNNSYKTIVYISSHTLS